MIHQPLSRRALLGRSARAVIGLPFLQAMMPAARLFAADPPQAPIFPKRLCVVYVPHGLYMNAFIPARTGRGFPLSPTLQPLAGLNGRFSVVGNLMMDVGAGIMHRAGEMFLTNERIGEVDNVSPNRLSMDRLVVKRNEGQTLLPSLELSLSGCGSNLRNTLAFDQHGVPLLGQHDPIAVFEQLFGSSANPEQQREDLLDDRSILDGVRPHVLALRRRIGQGDQRVLEEYEDSIRETERYLTRLEKQIEHPTSPKDQGLVIDNSKVSTRMRVMFDLMFLAMRADLTRVISFVVFRERADAEQQYPELGLVGEHHGWTHELPDIPAKRDQTIKTLSTVDHFHCQQLAYFLQRLHDTPEGNGTMLDHTLVLYGSGLSVQVEAIHNPYNLPILLAGGEAMGLRQGQHVRYQTPVNLANLHLTLLRLLGVECGQWKDSTGVLGELMA